MGRSPTPRRVNEEVRLPDATSRNSSENVYSGEMLRATSSSNAPLEIIATVKGPAIYLDNHSFINLERNAVLRRRFTVVLQPTSCFQLQMPSKRQGLKVSPVNRRRVFLTRLALIGSHWRCFRTS